jgi:prepilin-type N-terminal cleavage/methylation domain-containing protein/prepilin-type processing-associated H-X9-DG protein
VRGIPETRSVRNGFTLVELLVVIAILAILASLLLPSLARAKSKGQQVFCLNNLRQIALATMLYADDFDDSLPYNLGASEIKQRLTQGQNYNWAGSVLNWELDPDNTNEVLNTHAALGSYLARSARVFRCPVDQAVSELQRGAGWKGRSRSVSMNAMVGDAGEFLAGDENVNNPHYHQYRKNREFISASEIFIFIEEHPDSVNDGYFLNRASKYEWNDLPASWHQGSANLTFGDGHAENHQWDNESTRKPSRTDGANLPFAIGPDERRDFYWLMKRTSTSEY